MLDQNVLNSVLATPGVTPADSKKTEKTDADAFSAALGEATGKKGKEKKDAKESDDAKAEKSKDKKSEEHREADLKAQQKPQDRTAAAHLRKMMQKNVDTLSIAEKQALRLAEFAGENMQPQKAVPSPQQATPGAAASAGQSAKNPMDLAKGKAASHQVQVAADQADERQHKLAAEEIQKHDNPKGAHSLDQLIAKESGFAEELQKTSQADRNQERKSVIDQILQKIEVRNFQNRTELNLKLNPEYLGELKIKLVHTDEGVRADFETSSKQTRALLRESEEELRTVAGAKGIRLGTMRFTLVEKVEDEAQA